MPISNAVRLDRISRVVGYKIIKGDFSNQSPNLPQKIAILAEANSANQSSITATPYDITSATQAAEIFGYGSPIHVIMRILRPNSGSGVGGIKTTVYPQLEVTGAVAAERTITPVGVATSNATHTVVINGRERLESGSFDFNVVKDDTVAIITGKINDAINSVIESTVSSSQDGSIVTAVAKWKGVTSEDISISINTNGNSAGITYAVASSVTGIGKPTVTSSLNQFGSEWNTIVINSYSSESSILDELEAFNGIPDPNNPTGRYEGIVMRPFISLYGYTQATGSGAITDPRKNEVTNAICPAPTSKGLPMEAAANMALLFSVIANNTPELDVNENSYPDMPPATDWNSSDMVSYNERDVLIKLGSSTVDFIDDRFVIQDFVTSYHPIGENPAQFRYCRNLIVDFNVRFGYYLLEQANVVDHVIANDEDVVDRATRVIKPKQWRNIIGNYSIDLTSRGLISDPEFTQESILVGLSSTNPDRLESFFRYKRSSIARISSTTVEAGFNFGN